MAQCLRSASRSATCSCQPTGTSRATGDRKSTRLNSSHDQISYAVFCLKKKNDLSSLEVLAYGGSPMPPAHIRATRDLLPHVRLLQVYGLSETGYLTALQDQEHTTERLT